MNKSSKLILGLTLASAVIIGAGISLVIDIFTNVPDFTVIRTKVTVPIKLANEEKSEKEMGPLAKGWVPISAISNHMIMAVISSEDTSFFSHNGVDFHELREAIKKDWEKKSWARGGSTLTQQVVKNVFLGRQKTLWRKLKEFFWAQKMEKMLTKSEILCFYLNMAEWAPGLYGIGEASRHYFSVPPSALTAKQSAFLAMLLPSPIKYHSYFEKKSLTDFASGRIEQILHVMNKMEFIDDGTYSQAMGEMLWGVPSTAKTVGQMEKQIPGSETETGSTPKTEALSPDSAPDAVEPMVNENTESAPILETEKPIELKEAEPPKGLELED